jgi:hypothetical protein
VKPTAADVSSGMMTRSVTRSVVAVPSCAVHGRSADALKAFREEERRGAGMGSRLVRLWHAGVTIRALDAARAAC